MTDPEFAVMSLESRHRVIDTLLEMAAISSGEESARLITAANMLIRCAELDQ